jgi:hypothetical protein
MPSKLCFFAAGDIEVRFASGEICLLAKETYLRVA